MSIQAKDIPDQSITDLVRSGINSLYRIQEMLHIYPPKVVKAKLAQMVNKGRLRGCACGCRGDFKIPVEIEGNKQ